MNSNENHKADQVPEESSSAAPQASKAGEEGSLEDKGRAPKATHVRQNARHVGFFAHRLSPKAGNPREVSFADQWQKENQFGQLKLLIPDCTKRDEQVAATLVQWLGSNCGMAFLREVLKRDAQVREWLES